MLGVKFFPSKILSKIKSPSKILSYQNQRGWRRKKNRLKRHRSSTCPKSREQQEEDRLSSLPDSILEHILSFLPILDGVRSTILARRFRNLWFSLHTLDIYIGHFTDLSDSPRMVQESWFWFSRFVNRVLILHRRPTLEKFVFDLSEYLARLSEADSDYDNKLLSRAMDDVAGWILAAIHREPKFLHLSLGWISKWDGYILPPCVWSCKAVELVLDSCRIISSNLTGIQMGSLRILTMYDVGMSDEILEQIICGCPVLEYLIINKCSVNRVCFDAPSIRKLKLVDEDGADDNYHVDCPNLVSFELSGCATDINLVNLSSVKYADLSPFIDSFDEFKVFIEKLRHIETLKLFTEIVAMFAYAVLKDLPCIEIHSKRIVLSMHELYIKGLFALLRNSPYLEELEVVLSPYAPILIEDIEQELAELLPVEFDWENEGGDCIRSMQYLKNVTIRGYNKHTWEFVLDLAEVILQNAEVLDVLVVRVEANIQKKNQLTAEELFVFSQKLLSIPRASRRAKVSLLCGTQSR
ncbi:hypothetical protein Dimus_034076 [Dionaea muscipula]